MSWISLHSKYSNYQKFRKFRYLERISFQPCLRRPDSGRSRNHKQWQQCLVMVHPGSSVQLRLLGSTWQEYGEWLAGIRLHAAAATRQEGPGLGYPLSSATTHEPLRSGELKAHKEEDICVPCCHVLNPFKF